MVARARERLRAVEMVPFRAAVQAGVDVAMPAVDSGRRPATLSRRLLTDLLRGELGFDGVIATDCLEMDAVPKTVDVERGAVLALRAGADLAMVGTGRTGNTPSSRRWSGP